jgi:hypothetical protein
MSQSILYYIEPVAFRSDPMFLLPWIHWIAQQIGAARVARTPLRFGAISSPALLAELNMLLGEPLEFQEHLLQYHAISAFGYSRPAYMRDLFCREADPVVNNVLFEKLSVACDIFQPDFIISFSQNRYLRRASPRSSVLFTELGPLSRRYVNQTFFFDPVSHQRESMLVTQLERIAPPGPAPGLAGVRWLWNELIAAPTLATQESRDAAQMISRFHAAGRKVVLAALQPPDWLTFEGAFEALAPESLVMRWADELPENWVALVSHHPAYSIPPAMQRLIEREWNNVVFLVDGTSSEFFLPHVDAVATISSTVGMQAVLWGKPLVSVGQSNLSALGRGSLAELNEASPFSDEQRWKLLRFLCGEYCHPASRLLHDGKYLHAWLNRWAAASYGLDFFLQTEYWDGRRAYEQLRPA